MIEDLWSGLIQFSQQFVVPDWGALVTLIPLALAALTVLYVAWIVIRFATAGPTRRGRRRLPPVAPAGVHMPGPTFAPLLAAVGVVCFGFGVVVGGMWFIVGIVILAITLLHWGAEALRDYDRIGSHGGGASVVVGALPAPSGTPPAGVHMPAPSFRPLLAALGVTILVVGLLIGGWALLLGMIAFGVAAIGWLWDARREYAATEKADRTGHLDPGSAPAWPKATIAALGVIIVAAVVLSAGLIGGSSGSAANPAPGASAAPGSSAGPAGGGAASGPPASGQAADVSLTAQNTEFTVTSITVPAGKKFTLAFDNKDVGVPHNVVIRDAGGKDLFKGELVTGPQVVVYDVPAIDAGQYTFVCAVHPNMTGTVTAQ